MSYDPPRPAGRLLLTPEDKEAPARARRLRGLGFGTRPEPALDAFATGLADHVGVPYAMVNFLCEQGQFFVGLHVVDPVPVVREDGTRPEIGRFQPRDHGYCPHVVARRRALALDDVRDFPRFAGNAVVDAYGVRSYLGAPMIDASGMVLGTVSVADIDPRPWGRPGLETMKAAAAELTARLERRETGGFPAL